MPPADSFSGAPKAGTRALGALDRRAAPAENEERFRKLFFSSPVAHAVIRTDDDRYAEVNAAWERTFGWRAEEALGRTSLELGVWASEADWLAFRARYAAGERIVGERSRRRRRNGEVFAALVSAEPVEVAGVRYRLTSVLDLSAEERAREAAAESEARFATLFRSSPVSLSLLEADTLRYVEVNSAWERTYRRARDSVLGKTPLEIGFLPEPRVLEEFAAELAARGTVEAMRMRLVDGAGELLEARVHAVPVEIAGRSYLLVSCLDLSAEARAIAEVRRANEALEARVAERTEELRTALAELESFAYSVSHDLRAPARAVSGLARIVLEDHGGELSAQARTLVERIARAGEAMGAMVEGLLELSRLSRTPLERRPVDLASLAAEIWRELSSTEPAREIAFRVDDGLRAEGDPRLLRNLLQNLLANARKYTRRRPEAAVHFGRSGTGEFFVRDNGVGFDPAYAAKLFQPFQRLHPERDFEGHGIGLALARRIVERHGGAIRAEARPGEGATFFFRLDRAGS
jgi:PAS domain S-box-containing protein